MGDKCVFTDKQCDPFGIDEWIGCVRILPMHDVHCSIETDVLQILAKKRDNINKKFRSYYGRPINEIDVWPDYCHKFFPAWYCDTLMKEFINIPCMDHPRVVKFKEGGSPQIISEPYNSTMADMKELIQFCEDRGLDFTIDGDSAHFPGRCYRIIFRENKRNDDE